LNFGFTDDDFERIAAALPQLPTRLYGWVLEAVTDDKKSYGFLICGSQARTTRYFFLAKDCPKRQLPQPGTIVSFEPDPTRRGRSPVATNIEIVSQSEVEAK
jgi:hypothetical protein